jgi:hypothetical protein
LCRYSKWRTFTAPTDSLNWLTKKAQRKSGISSVLDADILTSYKLVLPSVFAGKLTETMTVSSKSLPGLASFPVWDFPVWDTESASSGIRSVMREKVRQIKSSYAARISPEAKLVAQTMLTMSVAFVEAVRRDE